MKYLDKMTAEEVLAWRFNSISHTYNPPFFVREGFQKGLIAFTGDGIVVVHAEGDQKAERGDWIVRDGEILTVVTDDVFQASYVEIEDENLQG